MGEADLPQESREGFGDRRTCAAGNPRRHAPECDELDQPLLEGVEVAIDGAGRLSLFLRKYS